MIPLLPATAHETFALMQQRGGQFFSRLADAWFHADDANRGAIQSAWSDTFENYRQQASFLLGHQDGYLRLPHPPRDQPLVISINRSSQQLAVFLTHSGNLFAGFVPYVHEGDAREAAGAFVARYSDVPPEVVYPKITSFKTSTK